MDSSEIKKLAETVEAGLRDGRKLDTIRKAMGESGYGEDDIRAVISNVNRKKTIRRPQRKKEYNKSWIAAGVLIVIIISLAAYIFTQPPAGIDAGFPGTNDSDGQRTCYVINESIKQVMIEAGAQCDKWYLIKEI